MQLLVGLGNPGNRYKNTRHNIGFRFIDALGAAQGLSLVVASRFYAETAEWKRDEHDVLLVRPRTFMNNAGESIGPLARYYDVKTENIFVIYDDIDMEKGKFRLKTGGGHGGHNGLRSLNQYLPDSNYHRLKLGIGRPLSNMDMTAWVLGKATATDLQREDRIFNALMEELPLVLNGDLALASNRMHLALQSL